MSINQEMVKLALSELTFAIDEGACDKLTRYLQGMFLWNRAYNLTAITEPNEMIIKHLLDSLVLVSELRARFPEGRFIDVGTGAGLPGIPLSIVMPECSWTLLDSATKRTRFLTQMKLELGLDNVTIVTSRVQDYDPEEGFDAVLSRAFASGEDMVKWSEHLLKPTGSMVAMKGKWLDAEWQNVTGFPQREVISLTVPHLAEERHLILLKR